MNKPNPKLKLSPGHLQAIGEVASEWSALEFSFQSAMVMVSEVPFEIVVAFTSPSPMYGWIDILNNLLRINPTCAAKTKSLPSLLEKIRNAQRKRNDIVHAVWGHQFPVDIGKEFLDAADKAFGVGFPKKNDKGLVNRFSYTAAEMHEVAIEIRQLADEFRAVFWPGTSPMNKRK